MRTVTNNITKEDYEQYCKNRAAFNSKIDETIPAAWRWGYGYYGCRCYEKDGEYFIDYTLGDSCD